MAAHSLRVTAAASVLRRSLRRKYVKAPAPGVVLIAPPVSLIRYSKMFARYVGNSERISHAIQWRFKQPNGAWWQGFELSIRRLACVLPLCLSTTKTRSRNQVLRPLALALAWPDARLVAIDKLAHRHTLRDAKAIKHTID